MGASGQNFRGLTAGAFDLLHAGHILMLHEARDVCDELIVALHVDPSNERPDKNKPIQTVQERYIQLQGCKFVDFIVPYETEADLHTIIRIYRPNIRIVGQEYEGKLFSGKRLCGELGIHIHYNSRQHEWSSTNLRERIKNAR